MSLDASLTPSSSFSYDGVTRVACVHRQMHHSSHKNNLPNVTEINLTVGKKTQRVIAANEWTKQPPTNSRTRKAIICSHPSGLDAKTIVLSWNKGEGGHLGKKVLGCRFFECNGRRREEGGWITITNGEFDVAGREGKKAFGKSQALTWRRHECEYATKNKGQ